jgi:segregation and condensation protein B
MMTEIELKAIIEALIYVAEEPISETSLVELLGKEQKELIRQLLNRLVEEYKSPERGLEIKEVANGFRMGTKPEHHEWVRHYIKSQTPPMRLSLAALETLAVIAYRQSITMPEIQEVRGVNAAGVIKTLIDRKLVTTAGRKNVVGRPIMYKTTKEFLMHFGLKNLNELPSLEEFEELAKSELGTFSAESEPELAMPLPVAAQSAAEMTTEPPLVEPHGDGESAVTPVFADSDQLNTSSEVAPIVDAEVVSVADHESTDTTSSSVSETPHVSFEDIDLSYANNEIVESAAPPVEGECPDLPVESESETVINHTPPVGERPAEPNERQE